MTSETTEPRDAVPQENDSFRWRQEKAQGKESEMEGGHLDSSTRRDVRTH